MTFKEWIKNSVYKDKDPLSVKKLNCSYEYLTDLDGIEKFKNLETLFYHNNNLTSLKGIEQLTNLKELYCYGNNLISLKGIEQLINLETLYCSDNRLTTLKEVINLPKLKFLLCFKNNLEHKNITYNNFKSIKDYQRYLKQFYRKDRIKDLIFI